MFPEDVADKVRRPVAEVFLLETTHLLAGELQDETIMSDRGEITSKEKNDDDDRVGSREPHTRPAANRLNCGWRLSGSPALPPYDRSTISHLEGVDERGDAVAKQLELLGRPLKPGGHLGRGPYSRVGGNAELPGPVVPTRVGLFQRLSYFQICARRQWRNLNYRETLVRRCLGQKQFRHIILANYRQVNNQVK